MGVTRRHWGQEGDVQQNLEKIEKKVQHLICWRWPIKDNRQLHAVVLFINQTDSAFVTGFISDASSDINIVLCISYEAINSRCALYFILFRLPHLSLYVSRMQTIVLLLLLHQRHIGRI